VTAKRKAESKDRCTMAAGTPSFSCVQFTLGPSEGSALVTDAVRASDTISVSVLWRVKVRLREVKELV
jgi:hypothetical protein